MSENHSPNRPLYEQNVAGPAFAAFIQVSRLWALDIAQQEKLLQRGLLESDAKTVPSSPALSLDSVERISYVLRVFRLLQELSPGEAGAVWLRSPRTEAIFAGRSPLDVMALKDSRGLHQVARFLEDQSNSRGTESDPSPGEGSAVKSSEPRG